MIIDTTYPDTEDVNGVANLIADARLVSDAKDRYRRPKSAGIRMSQIVAGSPAQAASLLQPILQQRRFAHRSMVCWHPACDSTDVGRDYQRKRVSCVVHWRDW